MTAKQFKLMSWLRPRVGARPLVGWRGIAVLCLGLALTTPLDPHSSASFAQQAAPEAKKKKSKKLSTRAFVKQVCEQIEKSAKTWSLPPAFFARLLWQESRFDPNAVSPVGAMGIAQFMPGTARLRKLKDAFEPFSAIAASAHFLADLRQQFGNLGLAAAAYNAGPKRVARWRNNVSYLPAETRNYVVIITGLPASQWNTPTPPKVEFALDKKLAFFDACVKLPVRRSRPKARHMAAVWQPWGGHLTADWSRSKALAEYSRMQKRYPKLLANKAPMVVRVVNFSFGSAPRYEVRVGQPNRAKAKAFCNRMTKAGGACLVIKTPRG